LGFALSLFNTKKDYIEFEAIQTAILCNDELVFPNETLLEIFCANNRFKKMSTGSTIGRC
jgi:hypothetical protein